MSIVDTWDWDKLDTSEYDKEIEMTADMKVQTALYNFESNYNIRPNRIVMGHKLSDELAQQFYYNNIPIKTLTELVKMKNLGVWAEYEGIPVEIDYDNPDNLEVGYMVKWKENKYE